MVERTGKLSVRNNWRLLSLRINKNGYHSYRYNYKYLAVHRIVYQKFIGELDKFLTINHKDGNPSNNKSENLEQISQAENNLHSFRVLKKKPSIGFSKVTYQQALEIRYFYNEGESINILAKKYNISKSSVFYIIKLKTWKPEVHEALHEVV